eukprot:GEMP01094969.1.p1 GENE.GEMP01094969.1~~GEMP01094969.1.p1  ORF type:complete len:225 (-),score=13.30 GEMP01094969.1:164-838(-)
MDVDFAMVKLGEELQECIEITQLYVSSTGTYGASDSSHSALKTDHLPEFCTNCFGYPIPGLLEDHIQKFDELCDGEIFEVVNCSAVGCYREDDFFGTIKILQYRKASPEHNYSVYLTYDYKLHGKFRGPRMNTFGRIWARIIGSETFNEYMFQNPIFRPFLTYGSKRTELLTIEEVEALLEWKKLKILSRRLAKNRGEFSKCVARHDQLRQEAIQQAKEAERTA